MNTTHSGLSKLAVEAGFGTRVWSTYGYLAARYFHQMIGLFVVMILYLSTAPYLPFPLSLLPVGVYLMYFVARKCLPARLEPRFYRPVPQLVRAQLGMLGLFLLLVWIRPLDTQTDLWLLYLPSLLIISRHSTTPVFILSTAEACLMIAIARWSSGPPAAFVPGAFLVYDPELIVRSLELVLVAFILHYLMRNIDARDEIIGSFEAIEALSDRGAAGEQPATHWQAVLEAYLDIIRGTCGGIWLCDHNTRHIRPLPGFRYCLGQNCPAKAERCDAEPLDLSADHPIAWVARTGQATCCLSEAARRETHLTFRGKSLPTCPLPDGIHARIVVPVSDVQAGRERTLGVLCIDFERCATPRQNLLSDYYEFLSGLARRVRPILHHVQQLEELRALQHIGQQVSSSLALDKILDEALEAVVERLGFEFALISLVDEEERAIRAVAGRNVTPEWIKACVHPLDGNDIQAHLVRSGRQEVLSGWDPRFDLSIWQTFHHEDMIRVFTPIAGVDEAPRRRDEAGQLCVLGTVEAGYYTTTRDRVEDEQRYMLDVLARQMFTAVQNAYLFERTQRRAETLATLHRIGWEVAANRDLADALRKVGQSIQAALEADLVMLYRYNCQTQVLEYPRIFGEIIDINKHPLRLPSPDEGVIATILFNCQPHYAPDAQNDPLLVDSEAPAINAPSTEKRHTFTERQGIISFAGVPMIASGAKVGVLCVNYRRRHSFPDDERQMLEIAAQFAAAALHNAETSELTEELIATRERMQLAAQLHHSLSQYLPAIRIMAETARAYLDGAAEKVACRLKKIEVAAAKAMSEVRVNIFELNAKSFGQCELREALEDQASEARAYFGLDVDLRLDLGAGLRLPIARELLMVSREAIANTAKHADASRITLELRVEPQAVHLCIQDDGCGFDLDIVTWRGGRGLAMMRDRVQKLNGQLQLRSQPGAGTVIRVEIPVS